VYFKITSGKPTPAPSDASHVESVIRVLVNQELKIYTPYSGVNLFSQQKSLRIRQANSTKRKTKHIVEEWKRLTSYRGLE